MSHLTPETLARLVDEAADPAEARHLDECAACRAELGAMREQTAQLAALPDPALPPGQWRTIRARLEAEGLLRRPSAAASFARTQWMLRIAAALLLFVGGTAVGALARPAQPTPAAGPAASGGPGAVLAGGAASDPDAARQQLRQAEALYLAALTQYSETTGGAEGIDPLNRLAALEGIILTTRAALREAPADPVINGYHLAAQGQREAILRQIGGTAAQPAPAADTTGTAEAEQWF